MNLLKVILFLIVITPLTFSQHGAYIAPVMKITSLNGQSAIIMGGKAGWVINNQFVIGGAFYGVSTDVSQSWVDPLTGTAPYVKFNCGGLNLEYIFFRSDLFSASVGFFMGGAGLEFVPQNDEPVYTKMYGGDFLIWEPQINANVNITEWFHLSLGVNYRSTSLLDTYIPNIPGQTNNPNFQMKNIEGTSAVISLIFGMY